MGGGSPAPPPPPPDYSANFAGLRSGQDLIRSDIRSVENSFEDEAADLSNQIGAGFDDTEDRFDTVDNSLRDISGGIDTGFADMGAQITGLGTDVSNQLGDFSTNMNTQFGTMNENMSTGFNTLGNQVDTRFGEMNTNMNTGFTNLADMTSQGLTGLSDQVYAGDTAILDSQTEGFTNTNANIDDTRTQVLSQMDANQVANVAAQTSIKELVEKFGANLDTYYQALSQGQTDAAARQAALQTGLDQFRSKYDRDATLANQQRGRIADSVTGTSSQVQDQIAQMSAANTQGVSNLSNQMEQNQAETTKDFASVAKQITTGFDDGSQESADMKAEFNDRLNTVRTVLADQTLQLDETTRQQYTALANSFDEMGGLITTSVDQNGIQTARAIDQQGMLLTASFNQAGARINQQALDINKMMAQMDQLGYVPGSNSAMQSMAGSQAAGVYSGTATPYASTY